MHSWRSKFTHPETGEKVWSEGQSTNRHEALRQAEKAIPDNERAHDEIMKREAKKPKVKPAAKPAADDQSQRIALHEVKVGDRIQSGRDGVKTVSAVRVLGKEWGSREGWHEFRFEGGGSVSYDPKRNSGINVQRREAKPAADDLESAKKEYHDAMQAHRPASALEKNWTKEDRTSAARLEAASANLKRIGRKAQEQEKPAQARDLADIAAIEDDALFTKALEELVCGFDPDEARDAEGKWTNGQHVMHKGKFHRVVEASGDEVLIHGLDGKRKIVKACELSNVPGTGTAKHRTGETVEYNGAQWRVTNVSKTHYVITRGEHGGQIVEHAAIDAR
jgi:hypothetical protein